MPQIPANENIQQQIEQAMACDKWRLTSKFKRLSAIEDTNIAQWEAFRNQLAQSVLRAQQRQQAMPLIDYPEDLPVFLHKERIMAALKQHQVIIVAGETGSGKTTQLPKICLEMGQGIKGYIGHTQPRRVAARTVATRIAEELKSPLGKYVGYKVRFTDHTQPESYIKLMTDGILLAELQQDRYLSQYDTLIIDEAHERSLNIDFTLGFIKQLLPHRPDLKVIITSATLDPGRFAEYFKGAPIIEVSGRTYPVELRYQPLDEESDQVSVICDAVNGITDQGDILVFLSGEREIHDTAEALHKLHLPHIEILPLYSRLSVAEQNKVFQSHHGRRIILATNVAETSLTVPGIRYVIDPGFARIKRYSYKSKIQRLPIEPISQASAKQRAGRCGRIGPGICIRLYAKEDLLARAEFTEPEILRSNLAAVILQMINLRLGDIERFPFINPPDSRLIRDGFKLLEELGALRPDKGLTKIGQQLARLPIDPRLGRMLLAAEKEGCLTEIVIIVSGLSIQDPRERPPQWQQAADEKHSDYKDERSDFLSYLKLWHKIKTQQQQLSNNKFRRFCRDNFLSYLRIREWQDVHAQLMESCNELKLRRNQVEADFAAIHRAILTGLLSHIGFKQEDNSYLGARNTKFAIFPGSAVFKKRPKWLMAMEIVETSKLFARVNAQIEPEWIEQLGEHLIKCQYLEPHWEKRRKQVVALEKKIMYGLVVNPGKKVNYGPIDPLISRELFIRQALVEGEYESGVDFFTHNLELLEQLEELEHKARRRDILVDEQTLYAFYDERIPKEVYDGITLEQWQKTASKEQLAALFLTKDYLIQQQQVENIVEQFPQMLIINHIRLTLEYRFEPGHEEDGVTAIIPIGLLNQFEDEHFDWVVPGLLKDKIIALIKTLPKSIRRSFVPVVQYAEACMDSFSKDDYQRPLITVLTYHLQRIAGITIPINQWQVEQIPVHLRMNFIIIDTNHKRLASGRDLSVLRGQLAGKVQAHLQALPTEQWERDNITAWDFEALPEQVTLDKNGLKMTAYPALVVIDNERLALRLLVDKLLAQQSHYYGLRKLFMLSLSKEITYLKKNIPQLNQMLIYAMPIANREVLINDIINAAVAHTFLQDAHLLRSKESFEKTLIENAQYFISNTNQIANIAYQCFELYHTISKQLKKISAKTDIEQQLSHLIYKDFLAHTPFEWLQRIPVYLKAIEIRLNKLGGNIAKDQLQTKELQQLWDIYQRHISKQLQCQAALINYRWLLEEYRISLFAQELKTIQSISKKRLDKLWEEHTVSCH